MPLGILDEMSASNCVVGKSELFVSIASPETLGCLYLRFRVLHGFRHDLVRDMAMSDVEAILLKSPFFPE